MRFSIIGSLPEVLPPGVQGEISDASKLSAEQFELRGGVRLLSSHANKTLCKHNGSAYPPNI
jgi:hypothetical protein